MINTAKQFNPDFIINCAAATNVEACEENKPWAWRLNVEGPANVAIAAHYTNALPIHFSTDYIFDGKSETPYSEQDKPNPINYYGYSKLEGEKKIISLSNKCLIIRTSSLFAEYGNNFLLTILRNIKNQNPLLKIVNDQISRPTYAPYLAEITNKLLLVAKYEKSIVNVSNSGECSWYQFAKKIKIESKKLHFSNVNISKTSTQIKSVKTNELHYKAKRPKYSSLNLSKAEMITKTTLIPWENAVEKCFLKLKIDKGKINDIL